MPRAGTSSPAPRGSRRCDRGSRAPGRGRRPARAGSRACRGSTPRPSGHRVPAPASRGSGRSPRRRASGRSSRQVPSQSRISATSRSSPDASACTSACSSAASSSAKRHMSRPTSLRSRHVCASPRSSPCSSNRRSSRSVIVDDLAAVLLRLELEPDELPCDLGAPCPQLVLVLAGELERLLRAARPPPPAARAA